MTIVMITKKRITNPRWQTAVIIEYLFSAICQRGISSTFYHKSRASGENEKKIKIYSYSQSSG